MNFSNIVDPVQKKFLSKASKALENAIQVVKEVEPDKFISAQKFKKSLERYGLSPGDIKYLMENYSDSKQYIEILSDDKLIKALLKRKNLIKEGIFDNITKENKKIFTKFLNDKSISDEEMKYIAELLTEENASILKQLLKDKTFDSKILKDVPTTHLRKDNVEVLKAIAQKNNIGVQEMLYMLCFTNKSNSDVALKLIDKVGENTKGLNSILSSVYAHKNMSKEALEACQLRKKFVTELLENSNFKLGTTEIENYKLAKIISNVNPENYTLAKNAILKYDVGLNSFADFLKKNALPEDVKVTEEANKMISEVPTRILKLSSKDTILPKFVNLEPEVLTKYLDEVEKINDPKARNYYIKVINSINPKRIDEILNIIKTTKPENAKHTSAVITCLRHSSISLEEIEKFINTVEKSGRDIENLPISNLILKSKTEAYPVKVAERILNDKNIQDCDVNYLIDRYISAVGNIKSTKVNIPEAEAEELYEKLRQGEISRKEYFETIDNITAEFEKNKQKVAEKLPEILEKLFKNKNLSTHQIGDILYDINMKNIETVEKYALSPDIGKIDLHAIYSKDVLPELESLMETDIPSFYQKTFLPILKLKEKGGQKRLEVLQELFKRDDNSADLIAETVSKIDEKTLKYVDEIMARKDFTPKQVNFILNNMQKDNNVENMMKLVRDKSFKGEYFEKLFDFPAAYEMYEKYPELTKKALELNVCLVKFNPQGKFVAITDVLSEKKLTNMLKGIEQAKDKYDINPEKLSLSGDDANDLFIVLTSDSIFGEKITYKFNKRSGNLVVINHGKNAINVAKNTKIYDDVFSETKIAEHYTPYRMITVEKVKNKTRSTIYTESAIEGQYDIYHTRPDGSRIRIGHAQVTPNGAKHVRRTLRSIDGSKTYTAFREDKVGNSYFHSVITDKTGKQISEVTRTSKVISKNHFISTVNGQSYDIVFTNKKVVVTKLDSMGKKTAEKVEYIIKDVPVSTADNIVKDIENLPKDLSYQQISGAFKKQGIEPMTIDRSCVDMLKKLPGDEWFAMSKSCEFIMPQSFMPNNAFYAGNSIFMSKELKDNLGVFAHELGHAKFHVLNLANDKELMKVYNAEKRAFTEKFSESRVDAIDYFLAYNDIGKHGLNEVCAETNLLTDTIQTFGIIQDRTIFLEQYFPNTIAYIRQKYAVLA